MLGPTRLTEILALQLVFGGEEQAVIRGAVLERLLTSHTGSRPGLNVPIVHT